MSKILILIVAIATCALAVPVPSPPVDKAWAQFRAFETRFNKTYSSSAERARRFTIFQTNLKKVDELNLKNGQPAFGITKFMDLDSNEFESIYLSVRIDKNALPKAPKAAVPPSSSIPTSFYWTDRGVVTPIYNQGQCGSCWDFSATEAIESVWALAGNTLVELSQEQILDCDTADYGCNGGWPYTAYEYVIDAGGQELASDYPYTAEDSTCQFDASDIAAKISSWNWVNQDPNGEDTVMLPFVYNSAPPSVCVDASTWQYYSGGVLTTCGDSIDHCVQIIGFDVIDSLPVWVVRNSWGADWGVNGFIYVERGQNLCDIATVVTIPVV